MKSSAYHWSEKDIIGGNAALNFVNTASEWAGGDPVDRLSGAAGFGEWAELASLFSKEDLKQLSDHLRRDPAGCAQIYDGALDLRGALWRIFSAVIDKADIPEDDLALLNEWKARLAQHSLITNEGGLFRRVYTDQTPAIERALFMIVEAAEDLLLNGPINRIHSCGGDACEWMFVDLSKNGKRRWCSMATCGNDAKVKKFRKRNKKAA